MVSKRGYSAALYMRLSKEDGTEESASITNQRIMLRRFAGEKDFFVYKEYIDDGYSGINFERPAFKSMINDIEKGFINLVITKDLSRLGRDYIKTGQYTEVFFPSKGVRYIAVNDYDSDSQYTDIAPFKNILNEMYARDISKKIRSAFTARMEEGAYVSSFAPYGYQKDPQNKHHLIPDPETAPVVKRIFARLAGGMSPMDVAKTLNREGIPSPLVYRCNKQNLDIKRYKSRGEWSAYGIRKLSLNQVYLGHTAQGKTTKVSLKCNCIIRNPESEWFVVQGTHEALIDQEEFDLVKKRGASRVVLREKGFNNIFSGIAKCSDCNKNMSSVGSKKRDSPINLACGCYKLRGASECTNHFIDYKVLYQIVLTAMKEHARLSGQDRQDILGEFKKKALEQIHTDSKGKAVEQLKGRGEKLDALIQKLYEDHLEGHLSDERFRKLLKYYEDEDKQRREELVKIERGMDMGQESVLQKYMKNILDLINKYNSIEELTQDIVQETIERIEVNQGIYERVSDQDGKMRRRKKQRITIYFRFFCEPKVLEFDL